MIKSDSTSENYIKSINDSGLSIYDPIEIGDPNLWIPTNHLEILLNKGLVNLSLLGLPLRTRSKIVKQKICQILGYNVPLSFKKTKPRFPGQLFDTYVQKANNLQIWNEDLDANRRYVLIKVNNNDIIEKIKVVSGSILAQLDTTGTLTQKYQAKITPNETKAELITREDTSLLKQFVKDNIKISSKTSPVDYPVFGQLLSISEIFNHLKNLIGISFLDKGHDQERTRGAELHRIVCVNLGYEIYRDDGQFPDILNQLLEIKLQTSPTIDLGLICPNNMEPLDIPTIKGQKIRHCDTRYAIFYARKESQKIILTHLYLINGEHFFERFPQFQGKVLNKKIQIPLPRDFFYS